jgi:hypothetical protein
MNELTTFLVQWSVAWLAVGLLLYTTAEFAQRYLYEVPIEKLAWRVAAVSPFLAAALVRWPLPFDILFYSVATPIQISLWFVACWLALRFQWVHSVAVAAGCVLLIGPTASYMFESLVKSP